MLALFAVIAGAGPVAARAPVPIRKIGMLDRKGGLVSIAANGNVIIDHRARRAYQAVVEGSTKLYELDLDTLRERRVFALPGIMAAQTVSGPTEWLWSLDDRSRRLFMFHKGVSDPQTRVEDNPLLVLDLERGALSDPIRLWATNERFPIAIDYHAPSDRIYLLTRLKVDALTRGVFFLEERRTDGTLVWERHLDPCASAIDHQYPPTVVRSVIRPDTIYLNCYGARGVQAQILRFTLGADGRPAREELFPAVPGALSTSFDRGSDRMIFLTTNSGAGRGAWVFDGLRSSFIGLVASGDARDGATDYSMGLDPTTGRLYLQTPAGFLVADIRRTPLPAGLIFRDFAGFGKGSIQVDPVRRIAYVPDPESLNDVGQAQRYVLLADAIPLSHDPPPGDPDALTTDIAEADGVTGSNISGAARGSAVRTLTTGGLQKAAWNFTVGSFDPDTLFGGAIWRAVNDLPADQRNRDLHVARVRGVSLTNDAADAVVTPAEADLGTYRDLEDRNAAWPVETTECHDPGTEPEATSGTAGTAGASCDAGAALVLADAGAPGFSLGDPDDPSVRGGGARSFASIVRDPARGLVARAWAAVTDLNLFGRVRIGSVTAEAEAWAHGRPGTAAARFTRRIADVRIDADGDGRDEFSCAVCDLRPTAAQITRALGGRAALELPEPDGAFYPEGSPGGFQSVVQKDAFRSYAERALNDDDGLEVPALQLILFGDGRAGRSRQVVQLAGVQAESHYGIFLLPSGDGGDPLERARRRVERILSRVPVPRPVPASDPAPGSRFTVERITERIAIGVGTFVSSPTQAALLASLWLFLLAPVYLVIRRRRLAP